jgi:DNA-binding IclR family transcriptional regulator
MKREREVIDEPAHDARPHASEKATSKPESLPSPAAGIAIDVLLLLLGSPPGPIPLRQLARILQVPRSTLHRVLQTLEAKGVVAHVTEGYVVGDRALELVALASAGGLPRLVQPVIERLHRETGETVNVATPQFDYILIVAAAESTAPLRMVNPVGNREAFHSSALGKAYLSALPDSAVMRILQRISLVPSTAKTLFKAEEVLEDVRRSRIRGYSIDDQESQLGARCVGAALVGAGGHVVGALSISGPAERVPLEALDDIGALVARTAAELSQLLGAPPDTEPRTSPTIGSP